MLEEISHNFQRILDKLQGITQKKKILYLGTYLISESFHVNCQNSLQVQITSDDFKKVSESRFWYSKIFMLLKK